MESNTQALKNVVEFFFEHPEVGELYGLKTVSQIKRGEVLQNEEQVSPL